MDAATKCWIPASGHPVDPCEIGRLDLFVKATRALLGEVHVDVGSSDADVVICVPHPPEDRVGFERSIGLIVDRLNAGLPWPAEDKYHSSPLILPEAFRSPMGPTPTFRPFSLA